MSCERTVSVRQDMPKIESEDRGLEGIPLFSLTLFYAPLHSRPATIGTQAWAGLKERCVFLYCKNSEMHMSE